MGFRLLRLSSIVALIATLLLACGDDSTVTGQQTGPDVDAGPDTAPDRDAGDEPDEGRDFTACPLQLSFVSNQSVMLGLEESASLTVALTDCDDVPLTDAVVSFSIVGEAAGSRLAAASSITDSDGEATASLQAGDAVATFEVEATASNLDPIAFDVTVGATNVGNLQVLLTYDGEEPIDAFTAILFDGEPCADLEPFNLPTALRAAAPVDNELDRPRFDGLDLGDDYTVAVLGALESAVLAFGCADGVEVIGGSTQQVPVTLTDIPITFDGVFLLDNELDLTDVLPPSVATALTIFDELTDDDSLEGEAGNYGLDPAAFILDFVYRELCCWETISGGYEDCEAQAFTHPLGDLEQLYTQDFTSWNGAQPSFPLLCGGLEFANEPAQELVQGFITSTVPDVVTNLLQIAGDLARAFTEMNILSVLTVGDIAASKTGDFTHVLVAMVVDLHDLDGTPFTVTIDLLEAGLTNLEYSAETTASEGNILQIPQHSFRMDFGRLLQYVYREALLPRLDCDPDGDDIMEPCESTGDLFATWIDCAGVGDTLEDEIGILSSSSYAAFCRTGLSVAGLVVEDQIGGLVDAETIMTLQGTAAAGSVDDQLRATTLVDGAWDGNLSEDEADYGDFEGTFTGAREED